MAFFCSGQYLLFSARFARVMHQLLVNLHTLHVQFVHGNFGGKFPSNGTGIIFSTVNNIGIELYHLQNTGKVLAFSGHEA